MHYESGSAYCTRDQAILALIHVCTKAPKPPPPPPPSKEVASSLCLVLHMCDRPHVREQYNASLSFWNAVNQSDIYAIDSCSNSTLTTFRRITRLPFQQQSKPLDRFYLSGLERQQMEAAVNLLPPHCQFVVKLTGKYATARLLPALAARPSGTMLAVQSWGTSYGGWHSEVFGMDRSFMRKALSSWSDGRNTERFLLQMKDLLEYVAPGTVFSLPRLPLMKAAYRSGDRMRITVL